MSLSLSSQFCPVYLFVYPSAKLSWLLPAQPAFTLFIFMYYSAALSLSCSMWDLVPWPGIEPWPVAFLSAGPPGESSTLYFKLLFKRVCLCTYVCTYLHGCVGEDDMEPGWWEKASTGGPEVSRKKPAKARQGERIQWTHTGGGARGATEHSRVSIHDDGRGLVSICAVRRSVLGRCRSFHVSQQGSEKHLLQHWQNWDPE